MRGFRGCMVLALILLCGSARVGRCAILWVEGEKPATSSMNRHPWWYDKVKKQDLSGADFISNFNKDKPGEAEYRLSAPTAGNYELWVRANPVQATMSYRLNTASWKPIDLEKTSGSPANIAEDGSIDIRFIAWVHVGPVQLLKGNNTIRFRMDSKNSNHGYLDCFVLANEPFEPNGILKPGELARPAPGEEGWLPFQPKSNWTGLQSAFDLRLLNEKFAGEGGFIGVKAGHFIHTATGQPIRFWAVNGPPNTLAPDDLKRLSRLLAGYGINMVRIHGGYYDGNGTLSPKRIETTRQIIQAMKGEGIYSHLSIYFPLWLEPKPNTPWLEGYDGHTHPFAALYFNPDFQKQYRSWWKAILTTPDSSGKRLIDEPAISSIEIINEDSLFFWTFNDKLPDAQLRIIEKQFGDWAAAKYGSIDAALAHWKGQKAARDNPAQGRLGFRPLWNMFNERSLRDQDSAAFLLHTQRTFYENTYKYLRELGFKGAITCSNWITASQQIFGPLEEYSYTPGDFIDRHGYFDCNLKGKDAGWSLQNGYTYADRSALRFEPEELGKPKVFSHPVMDTHYDNKPSMISETTFNRPNRYRSEAPLYYAAYGALQGTDCIVHFALDSASWSVKPGYFMQPWTVMSPAMMGQFPAAALIYRKGLISQGPTVVDLNVKTQDILALKGTALSHEANLDDLRKQDLPQGRQAAAASAIDPLVHYVGRTNVTFSSTGAPPKIDDLSRYIDRQRQVVTSAGGQLRLDYKNGILTIDAPSAQGASGNLKAAGNLSLKDISLQCDMDLATIVAVSLDGHPLSTSGKILLQVMTEEKNSGFKTQPLAGNTLRIENIGHDPYLVKQASGIVRFKRPDGASLKVSSLDSSGQVQSRLGNAAEISLQPAIFYYLIER